MARVPNPYRPGFNQTPTALAGREGVLAAFREALDVAALDARTPRPLLLTGGRGVGKTVVMGEAAVMAATDYGWLTVPVEVRPRSSFTPQLVERLSIARDLYAQAPAGRDVEVVSTKVRAAVLGLGAEVELRRRTHPASTTAGELDAALAGAVEAAEAHSAGLVVTLDEIHLAERAELADLAATLQQRVPDGWPLVVVMAGLPSMREPRRAVTYLERGEWHVLGPLDPAASRTALERPAIAAGRPLSAAAADLLVDASGGYPYAIQVLGHHAWRTSAHSDGIDVRHARAAVAAGQRDLEAGLYAVRWQDASPREREYLLALAKLSSEDVDATSAGVARRLGRAPSDVSYLRDRLVKKGTLFADGRRLHFPTPGMAEWIVRTADNEDQ
ncbi:MAG TPA: ATP-binding protein [Nocardioidaceae bacterium]|nr:ATP-binding protein [Nocardioidaceae bacterium]